MGCWRWEPHSSRLMPRAHFSHTAPGLGADKLRGCCWLLLAAAATVLCEFAEFCQGCDVMNYSKPCWRCQAGPPPKTRKDAGSPYPSSYETRRKQWGKMGAKKMRKDKGIVHGKQGLASSYPFLGLTGGKALGIPRYCTLYFIDPLLESLQNTPILAIGFCRLI